MTSKCSVIAILLLFLAVKADGAELGKRPFLIVQLCLENDHGLSDFTDTLRSVAQIENMKFVDHSLETQRNLAVIRGDAWKPDTSNPVIAIDMGLDDGLGLGVGNLGLPNYQVAVGFSGGQDPAEARKFSDMVVARLSQRWHVETVPDGSGALPLKVCKSVGKQ